MNVQKPKHKHRHFQGIKIFNNPENTWIENVEN